MYALHVGWRIAGSLLLIVTWTAPPVSAQHFYPDDPIWDDPDRMDMPAPQPRRGTDSFDPFGFLARTFGEPGSHDGPAVNVNTLGEVPNSSWYTNRHYHDAMSLEALARGPNTGVPPPDTSAPWTVQSVRRQDGLPRATVRDAAGRTYRLTIDRRAHPELATGAAMTASRLLYALGYNVPAHYLLRVGPEQLEAATDTTVTRGDVWGIFNAAASGPDGTYRVLLTRIPDAELRLGPFAFHGSRSDDANDIFPHEARRELRGLRVVAAWINHSKIRSERTQDVLVRQGGRQFVRHYLVDLLTALGSGGHAPKAKWSGHEHILDLRAVLTRVGTLGFSGGDWMEASTPDLRGVGHFEARSFQPREWRPEYPNPAFARCDAMDAFWAARQIVSFTQPELRAIVETAAYTDSSTTGYLLRTLQRRQEKIAEAYLFHGGGLDRFAVRQGRLTFADLLHRHDLAPDTVRRSVEWHVFDNQAEQVTRRIDQLSTEAESIALPSATPRFLRATFTTPLSGPPAPAGLATTRVYLRRTGDARAGSEAAYEVVGIKRGGGSSLANRP